MNATEICGDIAHAWCTPDHEVVAIADGLGHGPDAAQAAGVAMEHIGHHLDVEMEALFLGLGQALASTRGAAVGVARIEPRTGACCYGALGNTRAGVFGWRVMRLDAKPGIVGAGMRGNLQPLSFQLHPGDHLVMWTDGLEERLGLPSDLLASEPPPRMAETLLHRHYQGKDDGCVLVARFSLTRG